jgi:hypothetical protein
MTEKEDNNFILVLSVIGENSEEFEYSFRIIKVMIELLLSGLSEEYWEFGDVFLEEEVN